jgi:hypothetical protein
MSALYGNGTPMPQGIQRKRSHGKKRKIEQGLQIKLVAWALSRRLPLLAIPNAGKRSLQDGALQKAMGLRPGASDLFLCRCSHGYGGYWLEMKSPGEKPRLNQQEFLEEMRREGYKAEWFDDWEAAKQSIMDYLNIRD